MLDFDDISLIELERCRNNERQSNMTLELTA